MLKSLLEEESDLVVFMFREDNRSDRYLCAPLKCTRTFKGRKNPSESILSRVDEAILYTMDELDQALDKEDVKMVSINVAGIEKEYGLYGLPLLIHFNGNIPRVFDGQ